MNMLVQAIAHFFRHKVAASIIVLSCWSSIDKVKFVKQLTVYGLTATFSCNASELNNVDRYRMQGVLYFTVGNNSEVILNQVLQNHFTAKYKWLVIGDHLPEKLREIRYDADVAFLRPNSFDKNNETLNDKGISLQIFADKTFHFHDVYVHPREGVSLHPWAIWTKESGFITNYDRERILRRLDLKKYPLIIATPTGHFSDDKYEGTFMEYLEDESFSHQDSSIRSGWSCSILLTEAVNAQDILIENKLWSETSNNKSMYVMLSSGGADLSGAILRILLRRIQDLDFIMPIWPFRVGFTYLSERESSSNMYLEPFSTGVWWTSLVVMGVLAFVLRITSKSKKEKDGAVYNVLTTWLQQDVSAVPEGPSGRWTFIVLSVCAMLVHSYYTSAIVSALMSTGRGGPDSLRALADSKYGIACEDIEYMRYLFFDVKTNWDDLEYLKKKKMRSNFYLELEKGAKLVEQGSTAFHSEFSQIFPYFNTLTDDKICKLQYLDTVPETLTWITSSKNGQWSSVLRIAGAWITETGLRKRLVNRLKIPRPACRASLLAERVKLADIGPLICLTVLGAILSLIILGIEILVAKTKYRHIVA